MATSGSVDFSVSRDNLIEDALRHAGIIGVEDSASSTQKTWAARLLNMMVKSWHGLGIGLWARKTGYILPVSDTNEVLLGPSGGHATLSYVQTTLSAASADASPTITVSSTTGIANGYYIGIVTDEGIHWTTVNGAPVDTTVTLTAALEGSASSGAYVYVYQTKLQRPIRIVEAYRRDEVANTEVSIDVVAKQQYEAQSAKESESQPFMLAYDPLLDNGKAYFYPRFFGGQYLIKIVFQRPFEDFDAASDTPDFPQEAYLAIFQGLAALCAPAGGLPAADRKELKNEAGVALALLLSNDTEEGSLLIQPNDQSR
jgi:hypothetical protein